MAQPACRSARIVRPCAVAAFGCALIAPACSREPEPAERRIPVVAARAAPATASAPRRPVARSASTPTPAPAPRRRAFVDPPLPPELVDPPGLVPLPPRPRLDTADTQGGMRP